LDGSPAVGFRVASAVRPVQWDDCLEESVVRTVSPDYSMQPPKAASRACSAEPTASSDERPGSWVGSTAATCAPLAVKVELSTSRSAPLVDSTARMAVPGQAAKAELSASTAALLVDSTARKAGLEQTAMAAASR